MFLMLPGSLGLLEIGLLIFCLIDVIQSPGDEVRGLSKGWWAVLVIVLPFAGGIAWLVAGRPNQKANTNGWRMGAGFPEHERTRRSAPAPKGPDDDPDFLRQIQNVNAEQEQTLKLWEEDLRRREAEQRRREAETDD
jgi:hypothetical protein